MKSYRVFIKLRNYVKSDQFHAILIKYRNNVFTVENNNDSFDFSFYGKQKFCFRFDSANNIDVLDFYKDLYDKNFIARNMFKEFLFIIVSVFVGEKTKVNYMKEINPSTLLTKLEEEEAEKSREEYEALKNTGGRYE